MVDDRQRGKAVARSGGPGGGVGALAARALSIVAESVPPRRVDPDPQLLDLLDAAARSVSRSDVSDAVDRILDAGVRREDIADHYVPVIARRMGDEWCTDQMSFAEVTIGVSRLQSLLRDLGPEWRADDNAEPTCGAAMIVLGIDNYHSLGAMILAGQLRRCGLSVRLKLGAEPQGLANTLRQVETDAVFISASSSESLESLRQLVKAVKSVRADLPVVVGGAILTLRGNVGELIGADLATSDVNEALRQCGLTTARDVHGPAGSKG